MRQFGLIGKTLGHSFSQAWFTEMFVREGIEDCDYSNFPLATIAGLPALCAQNPALLGLNITIPYKETVLPYLHHIDALAAAIGAVNCIKIESIDGERILTGYNTDAPAFADVLTPLLQPHHTHALLLGTGGAAKAARVALERLHIHVTQVSRTAGAHALIYDVLNEQVLSQHLLIVNATPLGMAPDTTTFPPIPYEHLTANHLLFDMVYNPDMTRFMRKGKMAGATTYNGHAMLVRQAVLSWEIWNG